MKTKRVVPREWGHYESNCADIDKAIALIPTDKPVVVNINIGRGLAQLHTRAPKTYEYLCERLGIDLKGER